MINRTDELKAYEYFINHGMTSAGACGFIGNLEAESDGFYTNRVEYLCMQRLKENNVKDANGNWYTDETYTAAIDLGYLTKADFLNPIPNKKYGYGLPQWTTTGRKSGIYDLVKKKGVSIADLDTQLEYLISELTDTFPSVFKVLKTTDSIQEASDIVLTKFEAPSNASALKKSRANRGNSFYEYLTQLKKEEVMTCTAQEFINTANKYIGYEEKASNANLNDFHANIGSANYTKFGKWYGMNPAQWCQMFVSYCAYEACGNSQDKGKELLCGSYSSYTPTGKSYFVNSKRWFTTPEPGDVVYFYHSDMGRVAHVGIVVSVDKSKKTFTTTEGNTSSTEYSRNGGCVAHHTYSYTSVGGSNRVNGFGRPLFSSSSSSSTTTDVVLKKGSSGSAVKTMQMMLIACGYSCGNAGADGDFGDGTLNALKAFQKDASLVVDGIYGQASKTALQAKYKAVMASQISNTEGNVAKGQRWLNANYGKIIKASTGKLLTVDNSYGSHSRAAALAVWKDVVNRKYGKKLTPSNSNFGTSCIAASPLLKLNSEGTLVYILQFILSAKGFYTGTMNARYTTEVESAVIAYQKSVGLTQNGICSGKTWSKLFN